MCVARTDATSVTLPFSSRQIGGGAVSVPHVTVVAPVQPWLRRIYMFFVCTISSTLLAGFMMVPRTVGDNLNVAFVAVDVPSESTKLAPADSRLQPSMDLSEEQNSCVRAEPLSRPSTLGPHFVYFDAVEPKFGLTNQLITYTSVFFIGYLSSRDVVVPPRTVPDFATLIDVKATEARLPCGLRLLTASAAPERLFTPKGKADFPRVSLPGRSTVIDKPYTARKMLMKQLRRHAARQGIRLSTVMWHVPFLPEDEVMCEHQLFRALVFGPVVQQQVRRIHRSLAQWVAPSVKPQQQQQLLPPRYAVLHIRLEPDFKGLGAGIRAPTIVTIRDFLLHCVLPRIPNDVRAVYISAGSIPEDVSRLLNDTLSSTRRAVISKTWEPALRSNITVDAASVVAGARVTNHFDAAADLEVAVDATFVLSADFSSFSKAILLRRCPATCGKPNTSGTSREPTDLSIWTYNWEWSRLSRRGCADPPTGKTLSSVPFFKMVPYVETSECSIVS